MEYAFQEFNLINGMINNAYHEAARRMHLSDSELDILYVLNTYSGSCNQSALYKESCHTKSTINSSVKKMEREGYVTLSTGSGRNTCVTLTPSGQALMEERLFPLMKMENAIYESWSPADQETFMRLNRDFAEKLRHYVQQL